MTGRVRITECSGVDSGKTGVIIPWSSPEARALREDYPFVGGRTPRQMGWVAIRLDAGGLTAVPRTRVVVDAGGGQ